LSGWLLSALAVAYLGALFALAFYGEHFTVYPNRTRLRPYIYGLAIGVYCSSWTFYGAVGTAVREGWGYLPIYVGPAIVYLFALPFLERLVEVGRAQKVGSIADFIGSRFGKRRSLAVLVTIVAVTAAVPYVALQYKAVAASIAALTSGVASPAPWYRDSALAIAVLMALFAALFGARRVDAAEHHEGLMLAIAFESLLKLMAFVAVGVYAWVSLRHQHLTLPAKLRDTATILNPNSMIGTLLAATAIFCLPRQFQVGVIECADGRDLKLARWIVPLYLGMFSVLVVPIAVLAAGGSPTAPAGSDTLVLTLPLGLGVEWLALLSFLGGLSASTAMVVVSSIALATMISNDIVVPIFWKRSLEGGESLGPRILALRRVVIFLLALLAFAYYRSTSGTTSLASIGLLAFAAVAQFAPGILAALFWPSASSAGVFWGMLAGFSAWVYTLLLPNVLAGSAALSRWLGPPDALSWLWPQPLPSYPSQGFIGPAAIAALALNATILVLVSLRRGATYQERNLARAFVAPPATVGALGTITARVGDLEGVAARIVGHAAARRSLDEYAERAARPRPKPADAADRGMLQHIERVIAGSIGASSARILLTHALKRRGLDVDEVAELLDETSQEIRFGRQLLAVTMENVAQGISVVDADMRIVAWNRRYLEMFGYPTDLVQVGRPVADLIRWNARRGEFGDKDPEQEVAKRLGHLRAGTAYVFQRERANGQVYSISGQPVAGGGFVTTYTDVTEYKRTEQELLTAKQELEARVALRTRELSEALEAQSAAKLQAEAANAGKTRFVAAASHDLLQPLNAARLFAAALEARAAGHPEIAELAGRIDGSMRAAEELLRDLLDVAQLDIGVMRPESGVFPVAELLEDLQRQYAPLAESRRLRLRVAPCREFVRSDRVLLRRILQNYLSNALRYSIRGGVLVGCRRRGGELEVVVCDTGPGIEPEQRRHLYVEFNSRGTGSPWGEKGLGLGLSICERLAKLLGHRLTLQSVPGRGSTFGIVVPRIPHADRSPDVPAPRTAVAQGPSRALSVLVVDNDLAILDAMQAVLEQWGHRVLRARDSAEAVATLRAQPVDLALADYHLGEATDGLALIGRLRDLRQGLAAAVITADHDPGLTRSARAAGVALLHKPVRPAALRALLGAMRGRQERGTAA
jgi:PAS domain S-box-containing protein